MDKNPKSNTESKKNRNLFFIHGSCFVILIAIFFHLYAYYNVKIYYLEHLPHYDSIGSYTKMYQIINLVKGGQVNAAFVESISNPLGILQSIFAFAFSPILKNTPESLQLFNSIILFLCLLSLFICTASLEIDTTIAIILPLVIFIPDIFYSWSTGFLDMRRDPSFFLLLCSVYFLFFSYFSKRKWYIALLGGILTGFLFLSRGNAIHIYILLLGPVILLLLFESVKKRKFKELTIFLVSYIIPISLIGLPFVIDTFSANSERYLNPYIAFSFDESSLISLKKYVFIPFYLFFGKGTIALILICLAIICILFYLHKKNLVVFSFNGKMNFTSVLLLLNGIWSYVAMVALLCIYLKWNPARIGEAVPPFLPTLLFFFSMIFFFAKVISVNINEINLKYCITFIALLTTFFYLPYKINSHTPPPESNRHLAVVNELADYLTSKDSEAIIAFLWHDLVSIDTMNYYLAKRGRTNKLNKITFTTPEGFAIDFAVGLPKGKSPETIIRIMENDIINRADLIICNSDPAAYANINNPLLIRRYGKSMIKKLMLNENFENDYSYTLWEGTGWEANFIVRKRIKNLN